MWCYLLVLCFCVQDGSPQLRKKGNTVLQYQIAGIFDKAANTQKHAFNESMHNIHFELYKIQPVILEPQRADSYSVWRHMCSNTEMRPIAVFGPQTAISDQSIRDQCAKANIPHIQATWQPFDPDSRLIENQEENEENNEEEEEDTFKRISINFYPGAEELSIALATLLKFYKWESFTVLYEDEFGLMRMQKVLAEYTDKYPIIVRKLDPDAVSNVKIFKELHGFQESRIILDCHSDRILRYLEDASTIFDDSTGVTMVSHYQHYIYVSMDAATIFDRLKKFNCNSTWLSLTDYKQLEAPSSPLATRVGKWHGSPLNSKAHVPNFELEALFMDDIANHIVKALSNVNIEEPQSSICEKEAAEWEFGQMLQKEIINQQSEGLTGHIQFDAQGRRYNYTLQVNEIHVNTRHVVGSWNSLNQSGIIKNDNLLMETDSEQKNSKEFIIISKIVQPYFDIKPTCTSDNCEDSNPEMKYEGFAVDLVDAIFKVLRTEMNLNYTYKFIYDEVRDKGKSYGKFDKKDKKWDGLIGDLLNKRADLAVCDFTITEERKKIVDFSVPFMTLGISILFVQQPKKEPEMFSFLNPYTLEVWMYIATAYCIVSIFLYVCARISPADWENPEPCDKDPEFLENIWTFKNCLWLTMGSIMTQGCDILPKAFGTRWVCAMWWFFAVIVCQTYIAQLSASMTEALAEVPINSAEDLVKQNKILYGAYKDGSTYEFFRSSKDKIYKQIYDNMHANEAVLTSGNDEGEKRVSNGKGKYAFFMESSTIEYKLRRNCNLKKIGPELDSKDYGIAMPANSPFRSDINRAILRLKELNRLDEIKNSWWSSKYGAKNCTSSKQANDVEGDLEMENLQGAFIVLAGGLMLALLITAAEFMNEVRNIVVKEQVPHKEAFIQELKACLNFFQLQKPVLRNPSRAPSLVPSEDSSERNDKKAANIQSFLDFEKVVQ